jgi:hypothetical protein
VCFCPLNLGWIRDSGGFVARSNKGIVFSQQRYNLDLLGWIRDSACVPADTPWYLM